MKRLPEVSVKMICHLMESWVRDGNYGNAIWGMLTSFAPHSRCEIRPGEARFSQGGPLQIMAGLLQIMAGPLQPWQACFRSWQARFSHGMLASAGAGPLQPGRLASDHECGANEVSAIVRHSARSSFFQNANIAKALQKSKDH